MLILILIGPVVLVKRDIGSMATQKEYILMKSPKTGLGIKQQRYSDAIRNSFKIFVLLTRSTLSFVVLTSDSFNWSFLSWHISV